MARRINLAELRAARKMEPKVLELDGEELTLPTEIPVDAIVAVMDNDFRRAFEGFLGENWREEVRRFQFTINDVVDIVKDAYVADFANLGESLASATPSNGTARR